MQKIYDVLLILAIVPVLVMASTSMSSAAGLPFRHSVEKTVDAALEAVDQELRPDEAAVAPDAISVTDTTGSYNFGAEALTITPTDSANSLVLAREEGIQALTVLDEGNSVAEFKLQLPDGMRLVDSGQGYNLILEVENVAFRVGSIASPWAVDANGVKLPTSYEYTDGVIRQSVETGAAIYPIVVDPLITIGLGNAPQGPGFYLNLTGQVMNTILAAVLFAANMAPAVVCVTIDKIPHPAVRNIVRALCGTFGVATVSTVLTQVANALRASPWRNGQCYQMRLTGPGPFVATTMNNCA